MSADNKATMELNSVKEIEEIQDKLKKDSDTYGSKY